MGVIISKGPRRRGAIRLADQRTRCAVCDADSGYLVEVDPDGPGKRLVCERCLRAQEVQE